jgi:hypothetical protein
MEFGAYARSAAQNRRHTSSRCPRTTSRPLAPGFSHLMLAQLMLDDAPLRSPHGGCTPPASALALTPQTAETKSDHCRSAISPCSRATQRPSCPDQPRRTTTHPWGTNCGE